MRNYIKKAIKSTIILSIITLSMTACGGGSDASFSNAQKKIDINISCITTPSSLDIDSYITLISADTIVKAEDNTTIKTYHDVNENKKVCLVSGSAYILRD